MSNQLFAATGRHFCNFRMTAAERGTQTIAAVQVGGVPVPLVTVSAGNYHEPHTGRQKTAYSQGVVYFRHGAKSEPGTTEDLERFLKREIEAVRQSWLSNLRRVAEAPPGSCIVVLPPGQATLGDGLGVRIVDSPDAPAVSLHEQDWRDQYPYSFKSLTEALRSRYTDFKQNNEYHDIRKPLERDAKYCKTRLLDPDNPRAGFKRFYSPTIFDVFDKHYTRLADQ